MPRRALLLGSLLFGGSCGGDDGRAVSDASTGATQTGAAPGPRMCRSSRARRGASSERGRRTLAAVTGVARP